MYPVGKCNLTCKKGDVSQNVEFQFVAKELRPLLEAETCHKLNFNKVLVNDKVNAVLGDETTKLLLTKEVIMKDYTDVFEGLGCKVEAFILISSLISNQLFTLPAKCLWPCHWRKS